MLKIYKTFLCIIFFGVCSWPASAVDISTINYNRPVNDLAQMMSRQELSDTEAFLQEIKQATGTQIAVVTLNSLEGSTIEEVSMAIAEKWGLGTAKEDNGILITIARTDRKMRIEVGQGLEGDLPDAYAKRIIDQDMTPSFKAGRYGTGIRLAINSIVKRTNPTFESALSPGYEGYDRPAGRNIEYARGTPMSWPMKILLVAIVFFLLFTRLGRSILMALLLSGLSGGRSRGGGGFRGGGGGGYSGGGGGFSGGGASGGW